MSKDYENLMDALTNTPYLDTPLEYFKILDDDVPEGSLRQQLAGGGVVARQNFAKKAIAKVEAEEDFFKAPKDLPKIKGSILPAFSKKDKTTIIGYRINYYEPDDGKRSAKERRVSEHFGIKEYGTIEEAKKAAEAALESRPTDWNAVRKADVVRSFLNSYKKNNGFTGEEKFADNLRQYRGTSAGHTFEQINKDFKAWQAGEFEVDGIDRKTFDKQMNKDIKNWKTNLLSDRSIIKQNQFQFLDNLNTNSPDLDYQEVQKMFDKKFKNGPYWNEKTFLQRVGQLTQLKNEGKIPSNKDKTLFKDYGIKKGERSAWLKKANGLQFGGNYERLIRASDVLRERGQIEAADRLYKAAINFFGNGGIFTKLKGQGEHPLSTKYKGDIDAGDMNILKIDSLVEGDLNQLKRLIFDQPIIKLRAEYNKEGTTSARKEAIKKELNARKNFLNYLTSGSFDTGIVAPVEFKFGDKLDYISNVTPIDELPNDYDFGKFVTKGDDYRSALLKYGKEYNLLMKHPKLGTVIKKRAISADNIMSNVEALTKKLNLPIEEANEIDKTVKTLANKHGVKFSSWAGFDTSTFEKVYKGLKRTSRFLKSERAKALARGSVGWVVPLSAADIVLNVPIVAMDYIQGTPAAESLGTVLMQDFVKDITGVAIPGTTEKQYYEKFKDAEPAYKLRQALEDWQSTAELYTPLSVSEDGKRSGVFLKKRFETYPELARRGRKSVEAAEKDYYGLKEEFKNMSEEDQEKAFIALGMADEEREKLLKKTREKRFGPSEDKSQPIGFYGNPIETGQITGNIPQYFDKGGRVGYQEAGLVDKLGRGAQAFDPRNLPYYGAKALKGLGAGTEMAIKFPVAAGAAIGESLQKKPTMETLQKFGEAVQPTATQYLSEKFGLEDLIREKEKELLEKRPGAVTMGNVLQLGAEFVPPATGYLKLLGDTGTKLINTIDKARRGEKIEDEVINKITEELSPYGVERRDVLKIIGTGSAFGLAKYFGLDTAVKLVSKTKPMRLLSKTATKMPEWLPSFASKILDDADTVFKQVDEDIVEITNKNLPDVSISKHSNGRWEIQGYNEYGQPYLIDYEPPAILEGGVQYKGEFSVFDNVPARVGPDDVEFDSELVESIDDVLGGTSKLEEWTTGVKKKDLTPGEKRVVEAEGRADAEYDAWRESEWDE